MARPGAPRIGAVRRGGRGRFAVFHRALRPRAAWLPAAMFALFVLDAGPAAVQPWTREDLRFIERGGEALAASVTNQRVVEVTFEAGKPTASVDPSLTPLTEARVQILSGPH